MSEERTAARNPLKRDQLRLRLNRLRASRVRGMFGVAEIAALAGSALILVLVIACYLYFLVPARLRANALQLERTRLQTQLRNARTVIQEDQSLETTVQNITQSLDRFETQRLVNRTEGRVDLYDALNELIRKTGLRNTSGPTYLPLDPSGAKTGEATRKSTSTKWQSIYPGIAINLTLEGPYQNLRQFIHDIEASKQFIVINAVELERATDTSAPLSAEGGAAGSRGSLVSLRLDMATYFQRGAADDSGAPELAEH